MKNLFILFTLSLLVACSKSDSGAADNSSSGAGGSLARFAISGNYLYVVEDNNLTTYNIADPANPTLSNRLNIGFGIETIYPYNQKLFIGSQTGMYVYSIANPAAPAKEGEVQHIRRCDPVVANDTAAFVTLRKGSSCGASSVEGLFIYDARNLTTPTLLKNIDLPNPYGLGLKDSTLFVCCADSGLRIFNVNKIAAISEKKRIANDIFYDVIPYGDVLICYVKTGLALYDISNVNNIQLVKKVNN